MTLEEYIAEVRALIAARRLAEQEAENQRQAEYNALRATVLQDVRQRIRQAIPQPLRQFADYAGETPTLVQLQGYPISWQPSDFSVDAPGLVVMNFITTSDTPTSPIRVVRITIGDEDFGDDWAEAVNRAYDLAQGG